jgi:hypothetical protein
MRNNSFFEHLNRDVRKLIYGHLHFPINDGKLCTCLFLSCRKARKELEEEFARLLSIQLQEVKDDTFKMNNVVHVSRMDPRE